MVELRRNTPNYHDRISLFRPFIRSVAWLQQSVKHHSMNNETTSSITTYTLWNSRVSPLDLRSSTMYREGVTSKTFRHQIVFSPRFSLKHRRQEQHNRPCRKSRHNQEAVPLLRWPADLSFQGSRLAASADDSDSVCQGKMLRSKGTMKTRCCIPNSVILNFHYLIVALLNVEAHGSCCCFDLRQYLICRKP